MQIAKPLEGEYIPYAAQYINQLPDDGEVLQHLASNWLIIKELVHSLPEDKLHYRYAPGKWDIKEMLVHMMDTERVFAYRALCFARNEPAGLPGFEQDDYVAASQASSRNIDSIIAEYAAIRQATLALFHSFGANDVLKTGTANNHMVSVRALIYQTAGHELHHLAVMREKYLS